MIGTIQFPLAQILDLIGSAVPHHHPARSHPWRGTQLTRTTWIEKLAETGLTVPEYDGTQDYLYWVGCSGALVERNVPITQSVVKLLMESGTSFGVLGQAETCNGDPARRLGNEFLYATLAQTNAETMNEMGVKRVITSCPHCFNTFKNEYPDFGGKYEVTHHADFLQFLRMAFTSDTVPSSECR